MRINARAVDDRRCVFLSSRHGIEVAACRACEAFELHAPATLAHRIADVLARQIYSLLFPAVRAAF